ncbi:MAG: MarR family transcriptional regulator [Rickettsiales bacterium]|jgi:DNA-binding MarR family transcriptional regulator|nr:MarR family transcriptional regulator [Rickettsiales bacterium]
MAQKEFINLIEQNLRVVGWLADRLETRIPAENESVFSSYTRQQLKLLVRLHIGGRALLKDIAHRESVSAANLCAALKKLESDDLILREVDKNDRRNTWYSVSPAGEVVVKKAMSALRIRAAELFSGISKSDEARLTSALRDMNEILNNIKKNKE